MTIRAVTDGIGLRVTYPGSGAIYRTTDRTYRGFARARLSMDGGHGDVFELYLDDSGVLELRQLPRHNESGSTRVIYNSTSAERDTAKERTK